MSTWQQSSYGATEDGREVSRYTISNTGGIEVSVITYGGIITSIIAPNKNGDLADITTGFDTLKEYETRHPYFGAIVGRVANRTAKGKFTLDGQEYQLAVNNGPNHLHGGLVGFDKRVWGAVVEGTRLVLTYTSPDGEESYPGELRTQVTYEVTPDNALVIDYSARASIPTPVNLTNHTYFNLAGHTTGNIDGHIIKLNAATFTPKDENNIPTGEKANVVGTLFDLREPTLFGKILKDIPGGIGYDHNFCIENEGDKTFVARVEHEASGRTLEVYSNQPGVQFYTGHFLPGCTGKEGAKYTPYSSFCLETQNYPDAVNKPSFPNSILRPGENYHHVTWFCFGVK